jgi:nitroreductase
MNDLITPAQTLALIESRQSLGLLNEPAPDDQQLGQAVQAALAAPDHHRLRSWSFLAVRAEARHQMGEVLAYALTEQGESDPAQIDRVRQQPLRAPLIVVCITRMQSHPKVPNVEQTLSTGAAVQNLLLMLHAQGFGAIWRTGALCDTAVVRHAFGLSDGDQIAGFVYVGTPAKHPQARTRLPVADFLANWPSTF